MSNNKQKTAVEWYIIKRDEIEMKIRLMQISPSEYEQELIKAEQQAKEMEKERMIQFCIDWFISREMNIREYYEQTYEGDKQ
jgi:hypothetical protein